MELEQRGNAIFLWSFLPVRVTVEHVGYGPDEVQRINEQVIGVSRKLHNQNGKLDFVALLQRVPVARLSLRYEVQMGTRRAPRTRTRVPNGDADPSWKKAPEPQGVPVFCGAIAHSGLGTDYLVVTTGGSVLRVREDEGRIPDDLLDKWMLLLQHSDTALTTDELPFMQGVFTDEQRARWKRLIETW